MPWQPLQPSNPSSLSSRSSRRRATWATTSRWARRLQSKASKIQELACLVRRLHEPCNEVAIKSGGSASQRGRSAAMRPPMIRVLLLGSHAHDQEVAHARTPLDPPRVRWIARAFCCVCPTATLPQLHIAGRSASVTKSRACSRTPTALP